MNILALFCFPLDLELTSFGTLLKLVKAGHRVHVVIVGNTIGSWTRETKYLLYESCKAIGIGTVSFTEMFDYSSVTQDNVLVINSILRQEDAKLVIIPFWKSHNHELSVLSKTCLIACRGIGNILMYNFSLNSKFHSNIRIKLTEAEARDKLDRLVKYWVVLNRRFRRTISNFDPIISENREEKLSTKLYATAVIASLLYTRVCVPEETPLESLNTQRRLLQYGKKTSSQINRVIEPEKQIANFIASMVGMLSETYESHRVLLV